MRVLYRRGDSCLRYILAHTRSWLLVFGVPWVVLAGCSAPEAPASVANIPRPRVASYAPLPDAISQRIREDMTEDQVVAAAGRPTRVSVETCGQTSSKGPWRCKIYNYAGPTYSDAVLTILFSEYRGAWLVNSWKVIR